MRPAARTSIARLRSVRPTRGRYTERPTYLLFLTDGLPTQGETDIDLILANARTIDPLPRRCAFLPLVSGLMVINTELLDTLSHELSGRSSYVQPEERIDEEVGQFYASISTPVLSEVTLAFRGQNVIDELYPYPLPDSFCRE